MDPLTQGVMGAVAAQQVSQIKQPKYIVAATVLGLLSGMASDLDVLFRSDVDPLLSLEYHRHFTHSLLFIPFGGLLCAAFFFVVFARRVGLTFWQTYLYCTAAYATHGLLDACTSYGTQLLWPFSDARVAWNTISIIDPLFTVPLLVCIIVAAIRRSRRWSVAALVWVLIYSGFGIVQRERAESFAEQLAQQRGHTPTDISAKPSFANLLVWKIVYTTDDSFYVDAVRTGLGYIHYPGAKVARLHTADDFPWLEPSSQQAKDVERFRWFSNGYIALSPNHPNRIIDIRYSLLPNEIQGLWGVELDANKAVDEHVNYVSDHERDSQTFDRLWKMIIGVQ